MFAVYHLKCIDPWLTKNRRVCPVCKGKVLLPGMSDVSDTDTDAEPPAQPSERTPLLPGNQRPPRRTRRARRVRTRPDQTSATTSTGTSTINTPNSAPVRTRSATVPTFSHNAASSSALITHSASGSSTHLVAADVEPPRLATAGLMSVNFAGEERVSETESEAQSPPVPPLGAENRLLNLATSIRRQRRNDVIV